MTRVHPLNAVTVDVVAGEFARTLTKPLVPGPSGSTIYADESESGGEDELENALGPRTAMRAVADVSVVQTVMGGLLAVGGYVASAVAMLRVSTPLVFAAGGLCLLMAPWVVVAERQMARSRGEAADGGVAALLLGRRGS